MRGAGDCEHEPGTIRHLGDAVREGKKHVIHVLPYQAELTSRCSASKATVPDAHLFLLQNGVEAR